MARELPKGYKEAPAGGRELPPGYKLPEPVAEAPQAPTGLAGYESGFAAGLADKELPPGQGMAAKAGYFMGSGGPVAIGAGFGAPGGPMGMAIGGALGKMAQKTVAAGLGAAERIGGVPEAEQRFQSKETIPQAIGDVALTGGIQGTIGAVLGVGSAAMNTQTARAIGSKIAEVGAGLGEIINAVPARIGKAVAGDLEKFIYAPTHEVVSKLYDDFYAAASKAIGSPVMGRRQAVRLARQPITGNQPAALIDDVQKALISKDNGTLTLQEAISGSQAAVKLRSPKLRGNETARAVADEITTAKQELDDWLEANVPQELKGQWQAVREANFWKEARETYDSFFPQNVNRSANKLRGTLGLSGGGYTGFAAGGPLGALAGAVAGTAIQAPVLYGRLGIPAAYYGLKAGQAIGPALIRGKAEDPATGQQLENLRKAYQSRRLLGPR